MLCSSPKMIVLPDTKLTSKCHQSITCSLALERKFEYAFPPIIRRPRPIKNIRLDTIDPALAYTLWIPSDTLTNKNEFHCERERTKLQRRCSRIPPCWQSRASGARTPIVRHRTGMNCRCAHLLLTNKQMKNSSGHESMRWTSSSYSRKFVIWKGWMARLPISHDERAVTSGQYKPVKTPTDQMSGQQRDDVWLKK